ncbi:unnamed protein product [Closterium sp. NIES-64]|nr:unnamed protein product [Closterium sp. NIES-64]
MRSAPGPQPSKSDPWDLARGQQGAGVRRQEDADETDSLMLAKEADGEELAEDDPMDEEEDHSPGDMRKAGERRRGEKREECGEATGLNRSTEEVCGSGARRRGSVEADGATDEMGGGGAKRQGNRADADRAPAEVRGSQARRSRSKAAEPWSRERGEEEKRHAAPAGVYRSPEPGQGRAGRRRMAMGEGRSLEWSEEEDDEDYEGKRVQHSPARRWRPAEKARGRGSIRSPPSASREQAGARREKAEEHLWAERRAAKETSEKQEGGPRERAVRGGAKESDTKGVKRQEEKGKQGNGIRNAEAGKSVEIMRKETGGTHRKEEGSGGARRTGEAREKVCGHQKSRGQQRRSDSERTECGSTRSGPLQGERSVGKMQRGAGGSPSPMGPRRPGRHGVGSARARAAREGIERVLYGTSTGSRGERERMRGVMMEEGAEEEEGQEPEYTCLALRSREGLGLRSGGRDGRKGRELRGRTERQAGLYASEEEEKEEGEQAPEYSCAVLCSSDAMGLRCGGRDRGKERATKVRAWAVAEGEEKGEEKEAGVCELVAADTEGKDEKVRKWAATEGEGKNEREGTWACVPVAAEAEEKDEQVVQEWVSRRSGREGEKEGAVKKGGKTGLSSTDMGGNGWQPSLKTAELFGEIGAGAKTGVTMKDWMQAQGNKLAERHVRKLRGGRPELLGEAERESKEVGAWEPLATGEKVDHTMEEAESRAAWERAKAAEYLQEVIPVAVDDLHTVQLRDACCCEKWQQQEGKGIKAAIEVGREERGKEGYTSCGIGKSEGEGASSARRGSASVGEEEGRTDRGPPDPHGRTEEQLSSAESPEWGQHKVGKGQNKKEGKKVRTQGREEAGAREE